MENKQNVNLNLSQDDIVDIKSKFEEAKSKLSDKMKNQPARTIGSMMGDIVWLMSQSKTHRHVSLGDLEWMIMPAIILRQYKLFRDEQGRPAGAALWAYLTEEAEQKMKATGKLSPQDWGNGAALNKEKGLVPNAGGSLWLVDLIAPFHTQENKQREQMLGDLITSVFEGKEVKMMHVNPKTNMREELVLNNG